MIQSIVEYSYMLHEGKHIALQNVYVLLIEKPTSVRFQKCWTIPAHDRVIMQWVASLTILVYVLDV